MMQKEYLIGEFRFIPERQLLLSNQDELQQELDGKQTAILTFFADNPNTLITRDVLISHVWKRDFVADHTINTKISELRKLLGDDYKNPRYLKTHHQRGYELVSTCNIVAPQQPIQLNVDVNNKKLKIFSVLSMMIVLLFIAFFYAKNIQHTPTFPEKFELIPITTERGQEWAPSLSNDNRFLLYSHRKNEYDNWQIKIKELATHNVTTLTNGLFNATSAVWGNDNSVFYFVKSIEGKCEIWSAKKVKQLISLSYDTNHVTDCGAQENQSTLTMSSDGQWLYYAMLHQDNSTSIQKINLLNDQIDVLVTSQKFQKMYNPSLSNDNKNIAYVMNDLTSKFVIEVLNLETKTKVVSHRVAQAPYYLSWDLNSSVVNYIDINNNLMQLDISNNKTTILTTFQNKTLYPYLSAKDQWYIVDGDFFSNEIISIPLTQQTLDDARAEVYSSYSDSAAIIHPINNSIAFTSNRSKIEQIWIKSKNKQFSLTSFKKSGVITEKSYSPDGNYITFLRDGAPYIFDVVHNKLIELSAKLEDSHSLIWSCNGNELYVTSKVNNSWGLYSINFKSFDFSKVLNDTIKVSSDCSNTAYYTTQVTTNHLIRHALNIKQSHLSNFSFNEQQGQHWQVNNNTLYQLDNHHLLATDLTNNQQTVINLPDSNYLDFNINNNRIYLSRKIKQETKIKQLLDVKLYKN